ncbi:MAG: demethylmenaquinone methyltransferase [Propionicimonas sp.]
MFDHVADRYDLMNDLMTGGLDRAWRTATVAAVDPRPGERILDLAAGTGTSSLPFARAGATVVPADLSFGMLAAGRAKHPELPFINADALSLPFADDAFDAVTISFGLRNIADTVGALTELRRVTRPGGRVVVCEFSTPVWKPFQPVYRLYLEQVLPRMASLASSNPVAYEYLGESILAWPSQPVLAGLLHDAGWQAVNWKNLSAGIVALHRAYA